MTERDREVPSETAEPGSQRKTWVREKKKILHKIRDTERESEEGRESKCQREDVRETERERHGEQKC